MSCAYCRENEGKVIWRGDWLCCACVGAIVRFVRELNELPTYEGPQPIDQRGRWVV